MTSSLQILSRSFPFQLTSSQGGWRECNASKCPLCFSTHILTRRMTGVGGEKETAQKFSTHILTRRMTSYPIISISIAIFQLTSSQGGWHIFHWTVLLHILFNSHPHKEDDSPLEMTYKPTGLFNSHPHKENDPFRSEQSLKDNLFNSHPHKEDDVFLFLFLFTRIFSTHILTRRMTNWGTWGCWRIRFSTHILTRRMTKSSNDNLCPYCFSTHILTRRMTTLYTPSSCGCFFQLTSSQGGWQKIVNGYVTYMVFQLTSSQGGWPK